MLIVTRCIFFSLAHPAERAEPYDVLTGTSYTLIQPRCFDHSEA